MKLNQITVPSIDLVIATAFYKKLGFQLIVDSLPNYVRFLCPDDENTFSVHKVISKPTGEGVIIYFESENLDQLVADLKAKGIKFVHEPIDQPWLWREARLKDPDGNVIILYHAGNNRVDPPWKVG